MDSCPDDTRKPDGHQPAGGQAGRSVSPRRRRRAASRPTTTRRPTRPIPAQRVAFGTSGHRGSAFRGAFNEAHILAITEAICRYRVQRGYTGPLFLGRDTHALSEPATRTALEVLVANGVDVRVDAADGYTPTPAVSHAILIANRPRDSRRHLADGIVVTPSHNPPDDGGFKYNPPNGGPADTDVTRWIQDEANRILEASGRDGVDGHQARVRRRRPGRGDAVRLPRHLRRRPATRRRHGGDRRRPGCASGSIRWAARRVAYWGAIAERYGLDLTVTNDTVDPPFGFMTADWDGKIRMDPSSPYAMARLVALRDRFDLALGNDADADRHGVVTPGAGLLNPNHFLSAAIAYLFGGARGWGPEVGGRQDARVVVDDRPGRGRPRPAARRGARSGSSGSSTGWSTGRSGSAARRAPGRRSCAATAASGRPTRTGSSPTCSRASSPPDRARPGRGLRRARPSGSGRAGLPADRRAGDAGAEGRAGRG